MGNALCKEPRTGSNPGTGNTFSNLSSVICPNGLGKGKTHPMRKTYFTRSAVDASKKTTSATGWQSVGLFVPDGSGRQQKVIDTPPVAPPRKKRGATLDGRYRSDESLGVKNGFREVFGRESRRHSCELPAAVTRPASVPPPRPEVAALPARQTSCFEIDASNDAFSDFSKVPTTAELEKTPCTSQIPRVGNRKSDKFFGERLADSLSLERESAGSTAPQVEQKRRSERTTPPRDDVDKIEKFVEQNKTANAAEQQKVDKRSEKLETSVPKIDTDPVKAEGEDLMKYIDRTVSGDNQIGRRAEFLMAMLEDYNDSVRYSGMEPVEEPLIVPKRRKSKHICDDHDHMHNKLQDHEREASAGSMIRTEVSIEQAPRKPSRDFSRYKPIDVEDPSEGSDADGKSNAVRPVRTKQRVKTRDKPLSSPPPPPRKFQKSHSETQFTEMSKPPPASPTEQDAQPKVHTPRTLKRIISMPTTTDYFGAGNSTPGRSDTPQRPVLMKSSSSSSFSGVDLQRTRISVTRFTPEDYAIHHSSGADDLVKPKSKLTTRKISWKSNEPPAICRTPTPTPGDQPGESASFTIGGTAVVTSGGDGPLLSPPEIPHRKRSDVSTGQESVGTLERQEPAEDSAPEAMTNAGHDHEDSSLRQFCLGSFIESSRVLQHHDVVNVLDRVYSASDKKENIIEQFQSFLEDAISSELSEPNPTNPNVSKLLEKLSQTSSSSQLENEKLQLVGSSHSSMSEVDDCFDPEFEKIEKSEIVGDLPKIDHVPKHAGSRRRDSIEYMSDWFGGDSDGSTTTLSVGAGSEDRGNEQRSTVKPLAIHPRFSSRKESIEDVGGWFSNHNVLRPSFGEEFEPNRRLRRGSDGFLGYDLQRQYPFGKGRDRSDSLSAEMFEDITKLQEEHSNQPPRTIPLNPPRKKVLEHRNSSDALLMKVLNKPHLATNLHHHHSQGEDVKPNRTPEPAQHVDESNPLLEAPEDKLATTEEEPSRGPAPIAQSEERDHSEHSTLLKFLSKEKLVE
ncbi:uncharacterized protein LOC128727489 [Anopheles nili]|uniref:uncharacterized protein LOC128727489 n=1 Tax=Anopheles nili TaxID=185578 RepID=UPI00237BF647|nr:uncharacterized protein LOC128727489 [Anopheles nili]